MKQELREDHENVLREAAGRTGYEKLPSRVPVDVIRDEHAKEAVIAALVQCGVRSAAASDAANSTNGTPTRRFKACLQKLNLV